MRDDPSACVCDAGPHWPNDHRSRARQTARGSGHRWSRCSAAFIWSKFYEKPFG
jgi:hypothetical protein